MRRVEICSCTRWSSEITASVMYSSRPWRVNICSPRSAVTTAVMPRSRIQRNSRRSSARRMPVSLRPPNKRFDGVEHHALGADLLDGVFEAHEQALEIVFAGFLDLAAIDVDVVDDELSSARPAGRGRSRASARPARVLRRFPRRSCSTPGSAYCCAPFTRKLMPEQRLAGAGAARDQRGSSLRAVRRW